MDKNAKKQVSGFTLVEVIVVIAIIGVLAAILVPSMLGYVNKAKFSSINTSAKTLYSAAMVACRETDVVKPITPGVYTQSNQPDGGDGDRIRKYIYEYFNKAQECVWGVNIEDDVATAACIAKSSSDDHVGTYPRSNTTRGTIGEEHSYEDYLKYAKDGEW